MNGRLGEVVLGIVAALGLGLVAPAGAQAPPAGGVPAEADTTAGSDDLSEIVVTARRVEERAQDVPISMTIFTQRTLSDRNVVSAGDLAAITPGLAVDNEFGQDVTSFAIRGFVQQLNTTPSVAVYFDDAVGPRGGAVGEPAGSGVPPGSFFDLQNVQVLKGPQGTLFGRNTDGGAVLLVPKKPTSDFEGYVEGAYGNFDMGQVQGVLNVPLSDSVRVRLAVNHETRDGYENNISGIGPQDFANIDYTAARASVVVDITPDLENYTVGSYNLSVNNGLLPQLYACNVPAEALATFYCPPLLAQIQSSSRYAVANNLPGAESFLKQFQIINTTTWHVADNLTVKNIANYGLLETDLNSSLFGGYLAGGPPFGSIFGAPFLTSTSDPKDEGARTTDQYTWSDELQVSGNLFSNKLTWQGGGYVERSGPKGDLTGTRSGAFLTCPDIADFLCEGPGLVDINTSTIHYNDLAIFGQATYAILDNLKVTGGIRYTSDNTTATINQTDFSGYNFTGPVSSYKTVTCQVTGPGGAPAPGVTPANANGRGCEQILEENSHAPTYLLGVDYNPMQDVLLYGKYSRGYRQGSIAPFALQGFQIYAPEFVNSFEVGEKTTFSAPVPGTFDVSAHYNAFSDQQLLAGFISGGVPSAGIANAGKSRIWGIEVESTLVPIKPLTLGLSYAYLNTDLESAFVGNGPPGATISFPAVPGGELPFSPKNKFSAYATYRFPVSDDVGNISLSTNYTYTSAFLVTSANPAPFDHVGAYGLLGLNLHWDNILRTPIDGELFATNLTNRFYYNNVTQLYTTPFGLQAGYPGEPRMYGVRVRIHFGGK
jgi:iron complex outermembrane receptor protein